MTIWLLATSANKGHCSYNELKYRKVLAQGWPKIGDLSPLIKNEMGDLSPFIQIKNEDSYRTLINNYVSYFYNGWADGRDPGRILLNLVKIKPGDYVICCEGIEVKGIAKISKELSYNFDNPKLYEYVHAVFPVTEWSDIIVPHQIKLSGMGPVGIQIYHGDANHVISLFEGTI